MVEDQAFLVWREVIEVAGFHRHLELKGRGGVMRKREEGYRREKESRGYATENERRKERVVVRGEEREGRAKEEGEGEGA